MCSDWSDWLFGGPPFSLSVIGDVFAIELEGCPAVDCSIDGEPGLDEGVVGATSGFDSPSALVPFACSLEIPF